MDDLGVTQSLCPVCLRRLSARRVRQGDAVLLERICPEHGAFRPAVWVGGPDMAGWRRPKTPASQRPNAPAPDRGCPFDCGLCAAHAQHTCTALVEVTGRCDLGCPVCFAESGPQAPPDPLACDLADRFVRLRAEAGPCNIQLSGGEPTVRNDLPEIVAHARRAGFAFVQLNTNGLRLAREAGYASRLANAGLASVFLQFDGSDNACRALRGRPLLDEKLRAVRACAEAGLGVVLVPTLARGVNLDQLWDIVRTGLDLGPAVRGVHFQPMAAFGRHPERGDAGLGPGPTLPETLCALVEQSGGRLRETDFHPPGCEHELCSFSGLFLRQGSGLVPAGQGGPGCGCKPSAGDESSATLPPRTDPPHSLSAGDTPPGAVRSASASPLARPQSASQSPPTALEGALASRAFTARQWAAPPKPVASDELQDDFDRFLASANAERRFSISCMAFQDAWTVDLERTRGCCIHVSTADGGRIPFCLYNLTAREGRALYRGRR
ncbi:radical SAM protein [Fundidesulfovibrio butyratiphilus]